MSYISFLAALFLAVPSFALDYVCDVQFARQPGSKLLSKGQLQISEQKQGDVRVISVTGELRVDYDFNAEEGRDLCYIGKFNFSELAENTKFRPRVYKGYSQFKDFDDNTNGECDGGGMWGTLLIEKDTNKEKFKAHYVFKSGDHMGGTFDLICRKI